jgi:hypothetical protein
MKFENKSKSDVASMFSVTIYKYYKKYPQQKMNIL